MKSTPDAVNNAVERFLNGEFISLAHAERETGVKRQTITLRINGAKPHREAHGSAQKMPPELELHLVKWIRAENRAGMASSYARTRVMAAEMQEAAGLDLNLGEKWHRRFHERYSTIKPNDSRKVNRKRIEDCTPDVIHNFFS